MSKSALVLSYHLKESKRKGGFHYFIDFLNEAGYDIDWITLPVSSTWLLNKNDRETAHNFISLTRGFSYHKNGCTVRCFTVPLWIPAKIARRFGARTGDKFWPDWKRLKRRLRSRYDVILVEGTACQYAKELRYSFYNARIIYRPSDILATFSSVDSPEAMELDAISYSDVTACADETELNYYLHIGADREKLTIIRNPLATNEDYRMLERYQLRSNTDKKKLAVYLGVSFCDHDYIEYAASRNVNCHFCIIGPFNKQSHDNVRYVGSMERSEYERVLSIADIAIAPTLSTDYKNEHGIKYGYTGKIITYMKFLLPIVATCSINYLDVDGFYCADTAEDFSERIQHCLQYTKEDRESLRDEYLSVLKIFSKDSSKEAFRRLIEG